MSHPENIIYVFQWTASGQTGPGTAVPKHVTVGLSMEQGQLLNLRNMEEANVQDYQVPHRSATPMNAQVISSVRPTPPVVLYLKNF